MNVFTSLAVAVSLAMASALAPESIGCTTETAPVPVGEPLLRLPVGPALPPVYFCGEPVPVHGGIVARRLASALAGRVVQNRALYQIRQRAAFFFRLSNPFWLITVSHRILSTCRW